MFYSLGTFRNKKRREETPLIPIWISPKTLPSITEIKDYTGRVSVYDDDYFPLRNLLLENGRLVTLRSGVSYLELEISNEMFRLLMEVLKRLEGI